MNLIESVPSTWDDVRDVQFFRIVSHLLDTHLLEAASCLLGANDIDNDIDTDTDTDIDTDVAQAA